MGLRMFLAGLRLLMGAWLASLVSGAVLAQPVIAPASPAPPDLKVLVLVSVAFGGPGMDQYVAGLVSGLKKGGLKSTNIVVEYLDLPRTGGALREPLANLLAQKYAKFNFGLVFCMQQPALDFLLKEGRALAPRATVLSASAQPTPALEADGRHFVFQSARLDYAGTLQRALELFPQTKNVIVVQGNSEVELTRQENIRNDLAPWAGKLHIEDTQALSFAQIDSKLANPPKDTIIMGVGILKDAAGEEFLAAESSLRIAKLAQAPAFVLYDFNIGNGFVGGMVTRVANETSQLSAMGLDIASGQTHLKGPITYTAGTSTALFDWKQIERWGGNAAALPQDTVFINRPPTLWEQHKAEVLSVLAVVVVLSIMSVSLLLMNRRLKLAHGALRHSQENLAITLNSIGDAVISTDTTGRITGLNPAAERLTAWTLAQAVGQPLAAVFRIINSETRLPAVNPAQQVMEHGSVVALANHTALLARDGREYQISDSAAPIRNAAGGIVGVVLVFSDVTEKYRVELALKDSEQRYRSLLDNLTAGVVVHRPDSSIMLSNAMAATLLGLTQDQMMGKTAPDPAWCFLQDDGTPMPLADYPVNRVLASGEHLGSYVVGVRHPDRLEPTWVLCSAYPMRDDQGNILQAVVTFTDITERKQAEAALTASEQRWKFAIEGAGDGLWDWNVQTGKAFYSPLYKTMLGFAEDEMGDSADEWSKRIHPDDAPGVFAALQPYMDGKPGSATVEFRMACKDGRWQWTLGRGMVVQRTADGKPLRMIGTNSDITARKQAEEKIQLAASVFEHAREGIIITNAQGTIVDINEAFTRISGYSRAEAIGQNPRMLSSGRQDKAFYDAMWRGLLEHGHWSGEVWNRHKNGEVFAELLTISAVRDGQGQTKQYVALTADITTIKLHQQELEHNAHFDALTNLPNRVLLADRLQQAMAQAQRRQQQLAVAYLDLDGFKAINDHHGHGAGDDVLITLAQRMKEALREGDTLARLGGDEFVAVLIDLEDMSASVPLLNRLLASAALPVLLDGLPLQVSASLGVTFYPQAEDMDADQLLRQADQAMYQAKLAGKNRYHVFDAEQDSSIRGHHESLERIRLALSQHEFVLHYQPKVNMDNGQVIGAEALIRWQHPEKGLLAPATFLPVIEDHPLAVDVGEWVIDSALTQMELWHAAGLDLPVSVNIGARQIQQPDFVARLQTILAKHPQVDPANLELEVLETSALADMAQVAHVIEYCHQIGVKFALDDFGTGYSSLTYLKQLRVAMLKIDQSFVRDMLDDPDDMAILQGVIGLAAAFKREVIAEGVETIEHGTALLQLGCELAQGFGIARPMPGEQLPAWAATWLPDVAWRSLPWRGGQLPQE